MGKTKKNNKKGGGIGKSKPEKPHTPPEKTRKNVNFSPTTKPPSSPKQNKTKKMFISKNRERQKAVTRYENQQQQLDLMDMVLGKKPLEGGKKKRKNRKKRTRRRKKGGNEEECPICMEQLDENEKITTKCNHDFHRECFIQNCLTELDKGDFEQRDRENKVFQCPNCRGDTKADCLNDPEVRAIYEEKMAEMAEMEEDEEGIDEFNELVHQIETNLQETIRTIYGSMSDDIPDEIDIFLDGLNSDLNNYYRVYENQLSDDDINYISEELETLLDNAEIEYDLNPTMIHEFKKQINEQLQDVDFVPYGGKKKKRKK
jgi:hypothetical protein